MHPVPQSVLESRVQNQAEVSLNVLLPSCSKRTRTSPTDRTGAKVLVAELGSRLNSTSKFVVPDVV